jgi:hypothetical protein
MSKCQTLKQNTSLDEQSSGILKAAMSHWPSYTQRGDRFTPEPQNTSEF